MPMSRSPAVHAPDCKCCHGPQAGAQSLDELSFQKSACAAAQAGNCERLRELLAKNPRLVDSDGVQGDSGYTPLHYAARNGHLAAVEILLDAGADPNKQTALGMATSLHRAAYMGHVEVLQALIAKGGDGLLQDSDGQTALHKSASQGHKQATLFLRERFPEASGIAEKKGFTPLQMATGQTREALEAASR